MLCMCLFVEDASGYYDNDDSESAGPQLEAVVTIPIHAGRGAGAKGQDKSSGYTRIHLPSTSSTRLLCTPHSTIRAISANSIRLKVNRTKV